MWVPFLRSFPGNEAHKLSSWGPEMGRLGWGGQKVYVDKVYLLFGSLHYKARQLRWAKLANRQSLVFSERSQLSQATPGQFHVERILHQRSANRVITIASASNAGSTRTKILSVATPAEPCGEKKLGLVQILGGFRAHLKCQVKYF